MIVIPTRIDKTPNGELVETADHGTLAYYDNVEYLLQFHIVGNETLIIFYGEDGTELEPEEILSIILKNNKLDL